MNLRDSIGVAFLKSKSQHVRRYGLSSITYLSIVGDALGFILFETRLLNIWLSKHKPDS